MNRKSLFAAWALVLAGCTTMQEIPANLAPLTGSKLAMVVPAKGVQIYECRARANGEGLEWAFVAPEADLYDIRGNRIGVHGAGPFWAAGDGSRVVGKVQSRADSPEGAIPWLLLGTSSTGKEGSFSAVTQIQRLNTHGGNAPALPCTAGDKARVPYTADYRFYAAR